MTPEVLNFMSVAISAVSSTFFAIAVITYVRDRVRTRQEKNQVVHTVDPVVLQLARDTLEQAQRTQRAAEEQYNRVELLKLEVEVVTRGDFKQ